MLCRRDQVALAAMFGRIPLSPAILKDLRRRMSGPSRHYHALPHLAELWLRHRTVASGRLLTPQAQKLLACAIAFHDAVYEARRTDNEHASARLWRLRACMARRLPRTVVARVARAIEATAQHTNGDPLEARRDPVARWLLDLDLTPIAAPRHRFVQNSSLLRSEFVFVPMQDWRVRNQTFFGSLAARGRLYHSRRIAAVCEAPARANLARVLRKAAEPATTRRRVRAREPGPGSR
jgi:predicted metal-dependent HD superfamily phosphohydrolase